MNITVSDKYTHRSTWVVPIQGTPIFVADGVLLAAHFQGMPYVQVWPKTHAYADHFFNTQYQRLIGNNYWSPTQTTKCPIVVLPWSDIPLINDPNMPTGKAIWPAPPFEINKQRNLTVETYCEGDYPSTLLDIKESENITVNIYLRGTAAWLWMMKGGINIQEPTCKNITVNVMCGTFISQVIVRGLFSNDTYVTVHSSCEVRGRSWDAGMVHVNPRKDISGIPSYSESRGKIFCFGKQNDDAVARELKNFSLNQPHNKVYLDDWSREFYVVTDGEAYACGPNNSIEASNTWLDLRNGTDWDAKKKYCTKWGPNLQGTKILKGTTWVMK